MHDRPLPAPDPARARCAPPTRPGSSPGLRLGVSPGSSLGSSLGSSPGLRLGVSPGLRLGLWLGLLLALLGPGSPASAQSGSAQNGPTLLREEATLPLPAAAGAVAINADESILAAATPEGRGRWRVHLFDRPSRGRLGAIVAKVGKQPRLRFSPVADLLVIAGSEAVQLWQLPIAPLDPDQTLPEEHRRWEVRAAEPIGGADFGTPPSMVYWSVGGALYRRGVEPGLPFDGEPAWRPDSPQQALDGFAFDPDGSRVALLFPADKAFGMLDLNGMQRLADLVGHRFPVVAARFRPERPLLSLDAGNNLAQWQDQSRPLAVTHLEALPEGFRPATLFELGPQYLLTVGADGNGLVIDPRSGRPAGRLRGDGPERVQPSPTGRYLLAGDGRTLRLYGFARPAAPLDYVRRLRRMEAFSMAQSYVRLMDDSGISPQLKGDLLNEAGREPPGRRLQNALERLRQSEQEGDTDRIRYWAEQVLALRADHPDAVSALRRLRTLLDALALKQAREAYNQGQHKLAISLLAGQVREDSPHYPEALEVIRAAEAGRAVETTLVQARERLDLGDFVAAEALVHEALRKDAENPAALALADEIGDRSGATERQLLAAGIGLLLALALMGLLVARWRRKLAPLARKLRLDEDLPPRGATGRGTPRAARARGAGLGGAQTIHEPRQPQGERAPRRSPQADAARRSVIETLIQESEERLQRLRQTDLQGRHKARLMELEAELGAIRRRVADPTADLGPLHTRMREIDAQVRAVRIDAKGTAGGGASQRAQRPNGAAGARPAGAQQAGAQQAGAQQAGAQQGRAQGAGGTAEPPRPGAAGKGPEPTHYQVLRLTAEATVEQIREAYHKLIKEYHPDLHNASQFDWVKAESERMSRRIAEAYQILSDASARARYDRDLRDREQSTR